MKKDAKDKKPVHSNTVPQDVGQRHRLNRSTLSILDELEEKEKQLGEKDKQLSNRLDYQQRQIESLKRSSDGYSLARSRIIQTYRRDLDGSPNRLNSRVAQVVQGDLTADTHLYIERIRSDEDTFQSLYVLDLETAFRVVQAENWDLIDLFDSFATMKLEHKAIDPDLQHGFDGLYHQLKNSDSITNSFADSTEPVNATYAALRARLRGRH